MKKIINGKKYDVETAKPIAYFSPHDRRYEENLFQKTNGEFFLAGEGEANSKYAERLDSSSYTSGSDIFPLTLDEAKKWVEQYINEKYEDIFGEVPE